MSAGTFTDLMPLLALAGVAALAFVAICVLGTIVAYWLAWKVIGVFRWLTWKFYVRLATRWEDRLEDQYFEQSTAHLVGDWKVGRRS